MSRGYHNTVPVSGDLLIKFQEKALHQESIILRFFEMNPAKAFTPIQVHIALCRLNLVYPLTSVRRSITNWTNEGELIKHEDKKKVERYGAQNNTWQYNVGKDRTGQF
jgi:hypothetical protein